MAVTKIAPSMVGAAGSSSTSMFVRDPEINSEGKPEYSEDMVSGLFSRLVLLGVLATPFMIAHGAVKKGHMSDSYMVNVIASGIPVLVGSAVLATVGYYKGKEHADDHVPGGVSYGYREKERVSSIFASMFAAPVPIAAAYYAFKD